MARSLENGTTPAWPVPTGSGVPGGILMSWSGESTPGASARIAAPHRVVFLLDVDNTLIDNDRVAADLQRFLVREVGPERQQHYWAIFEQLRAELGYADYLGALQRYRLAYPRDTHLLAVS